jgi:radical SAM superfamily enzyme YgiQ (UPF0313 family)
LKVSFLIPPVLDKTHDVDRCFGCNYGTYFLPLLPVLYSATVLKDIAEIVSIQDFAALRKTEADFRNFIQTDDSEIYIFYTVFLSQKTDVLARAIIRQFKKNAFFVFSGPQATYAPELFLDKDDTCAVRGEPEFVIREVVQAIKSKSDFSQIRGLSYRRQQKIIHNLPAPFISDIDKIPVPDRTLLDHTPYCNPKLHAMPHTAALTSRGCYGRCWFCVPNSLSYARELEYKKYHHKKPPARLHSVERVIMEFRTIYELGFKSVSITDDEFLWDEKRTIDICGGIKDLKLEWCCLARSDKVTENAVKSMAEAGCAYVDLGAESFDQGVLDAIKKDMSVEDTKRAIRILRDYGISPEINVLLGATPQETEATIKKTLKEVKRAGADYVLFNIANPYPGTEFYDAAKKNGWLTYGDYIPADGTRESIIAYPHLSKERLERFIAYAYLSYYFNPRYILKEILRLKGYKDFKNKFSAALRLIRRNFLHKPQ